MNLKYKFMLVNLVFHIFVGSNQSFHTYEFKHTTNSYNYFMYHVLFHVYIHMISHMNIYIYIYVYLCI